MSKEQPQPQEPFAFTEQEKLWDKISDSRFRALLNDPGTTIHKADLDSNNYGEFLFVTVSRAEEGRQQALTFYGYGYHEHRERWFIEEWAWYTTNLFPKTLEQRLTRQEAEQLLETRQQEIAPFVVKDQQTGRGKLFEMIADLTDDDGAISEMEDLGDLWNNFADGEFE